MDAASMQMLAVGLATGLGMLGPALGIGMIGYAGLSGIARNPEAKGAIQTNMILAIAFAEAIGIYVLVLAIILAMVV